MSVVESKEVNGHKRMNDTERNSKYKLTSKLLICKVLNAIEKWTQNNVHRRTWSAVYVILTMRIQIRYFRRGIARAL